MSIVWVNEIVDTDSLELGVKPLLLCIEWRHLRRFNNLIRLPPGSLWISFGFFQLGGDLEVDPELSGGITYLIRSGSTSGFPKRSWQTPQKKDVRNILLAVTIT